MSDEFFEIPGASGDAGGGGGGQGASGDPAPADRNATLEGRIDRLGEALQTLVERDRKNEQNSAVSDLKRRISAALNKKQQEVDAAENTLASAYEDGDGPAIAKAQRKLSELTATMERMRAEGQGAIREAENEAKAGAAGGSGKKLDTTNLDKWKDKNKVWFGVDTTMTQDAIAIGRQIESAGQIETGSHQYYEAIDREMARRYPDRLKGSPGGAPQARDTGGTTGGVTRIPREVADGWRRMGINVDDPAVAKRMLGHRQEAVDKGILPSEPRYGRVLER